MQGPPPSPLCFFWDLQNCAVPSKSSSYECVNKIRAVVPKGEKTIEVSFNAYADTSSLSQEVRQEFSRARVNLRDVPSQKPGAADIRLLQDILHHTMMHRSGIIVLISGDIDFAETVHDLVHTGGYHVVLVHNRQARPELCKNASKALNFEEIVGGVVDGAKKEKKKEKDKTKPAKVGTAAKQSKPGEQVQEGKKKKEEKKKEEKKSAPAAKKQPNAKRWPCQGCAKTFSSQESRDMHVEMTGHAVEWECQECGKVFQSERGLEQHQEATGHDQISCSECGSAFNSMRSLSQHLDATKHCSYMTWSCPQCGDTWNRLKDVLDHVRLDHV